MRKIRVQCPTKNLDEYRKLAELACRLGATHLTASQTELSMWQWNENRFDPYPNWSLHRATLFKFIVPEELKDYLPADYAGRNLEMLEKRMGILKEFGLKAIFDGMEPAYLPEQVYLDHPAWRGARCDHPHRARSEYYAPCVDDPEMRAIYVRTVSELCRIAPFDTFELATNDSGSGLCWNDRLYPGPNGPSACRDIPVGKRVVNYLSIFQEGARQAGLSNVTVNVRNILAHDVPAILPLLREGQFINNQNRTGSIAAREIGFKNYYLEYTSPVESLTRLGRVAEQVQEVRKYPENDLIIAFRSFQEKDSMRFVLKYYDKMKPGPVALAQALMDEAAQYVGKDHAEELCQAWRNIEKAYDQVSFLDRGGHVLVLGPVQQRWLTRPLVACPELLAKEERDYYREFQFQARTEDEANDLLNLQGHCWLRGCYPAMQKRFNETIRLVGQTADIMKKLIAFAVDPDAKDYLESQHLKLRLYGALWRNIRNTVACQTILDTVDRDELPAPLPACGRGGDRRYQDFNEITRSEIDNTLEIISLLEQAKEPILQTADTPEFENIMLLGPDIVNRLRKKIAVMESHRRDVTRLFREPDK